MSSELLTSGDVARLGGVSRDAVHLWEESGKLQAAAKTPGGVRLFERETVERFLEQRSK